MALNLQSIKTFLTLKLSQYSKSGSMFPSSEPAVTLAYLETPCACACQFDPPKLCLSAAPRAWPLIFAVKTFNCLVEKPSRVTTRWQAGAWTWTQTWTLQPDQCVVYVLSTPKSQNKLRWVWILFKSVEKPTSTAVSWHQPDWCTLLVWYYGSKTLNGCQSLAVWQTILSFCCTWSLQRTLQGLCSSFQCFVS